MVRESGARPDAKGKRMPSRRIRLDRVLGRGTYGAVFSATLETGDGFSKPVAVKRLHPELADEPEHLARLRDEAQMLGLVRHRAIVRVDGLVRLDGGWVLVMEHVPGVNLRRLLQEGPLPPTVALEIVAEIANALHTAYTSDGPRGPLRLVHRDLKPSNLQITPAGEVKVLDFGIATAELVHREACTGAGILGSLGYMAPERLDGIDGPAGDVYALGVVAWEMLLGRRLGRTSSHRHRHECFHREAAHDLRAAMGEEGEDLARLILSMIAYDPADRPSTKDVERRCRLLRRGLTGEWLADFADRVVPTLADDAARPAVPSSALPRIRSRWPVVAASAALGAVLVAGALALRSISAPPLPDLEIAAIAPRPSLPQDATPALEALPASVAVVEAVPVVLREVAPASVAVREPGPAPVAVREAVEVAETVPATVAVRDAVPASVAVREAVPALVAVREAVPVPAREPPASVAVRAVPASVVEAEAPAPAAQIVPRPVKPAARLAATTRPVRIAPAAKAAPELPVDDAELSDSADRADGAEAADRADGADPADRADAAHRAEAAAAEAAPPVDQIAERTDHADHADPAELDDRAELDDTGEDGAVAYEDVTVLPVVGPAP